MKQTLLGGISKEQYASSDDGDDSVSTAELQKLVDIIRDDGTFINSPHNQKRLLALQTATLVHRLNEPTVRALLELDATTYDRIIREFRGLLGNNSKRFCRNLSIRSRPNTHPLALTVGKLRTLHVALTTKPSRYSKRQECRQTH